MVNRAAGGRDGSLILTFGSFGGEPERLQAALAYVSACGVAGVVGTVASAGNTVVSTGNQVQINALKGLIVAEQFYKATAATVQTAVPHLPTATLVQVRATNVKVTNALIAAKNATDDVARAVAVAEAMSATLQLRELVAGH